MECNMSDWKPEYALNYLVQQVEEQSSLCDVTVKMGYWEKKFHRCVLVISPFFDHILNDNFLEKQRGEIKMTIGTPDSLQTAIMYLYGKKPKLSQENIENVLEMAEFLLIPNLKAACIIWLNSTVITEDNCLEFLQISSINDFEIERCVDFIEENLPEMLDHPLMINLTQESVQMLFSDKRLSYVPMDNKLLFLFKWSEAVNSRKVHLTELLTTINFNEVSNSLMQNLTHKYADFIQIDRNSPVVENQQVLFMKGYDMSFKTCNTFWCLDLEREQWFRFNSESFIKERSDLYKNISGTCSTASGPVVLFSDGDFQLSRILMLNLQIDKCTKVNIKGKDESFRITRNDNFKICGDLCVASLNEQNTIHKKSKNNSVINYLRTQGLPNNVMTRRSSTDRLMAIQKTLRERTIHIRTSTLYIGYIADGNVEMSPSLSFKDDEIHRLLISETAIAIMFKSQKYVAIDDLGECSLLKIEQSTSHEDHLVQFENGFLIHDNTRCISLTRANGPYHSNKYEVCEIPFENTEFKHIVYCFKGQMWYRYHRKSYHEGPGVLETVPCHAVLRRKLKESLSWKQLPLPPKAYYFENIFSSECFSMFLPKSMLRCDISCPHCEPSTRTDKYPYSIVYGLINFIDAHWPDDDPLDNLMNYNADFCSYD
ncbi:uncharacterized protein LOC132754621 [Ruditapes philippinarum]|uniref:uncharacterized protein LOC132754621 n=1 Tax=Ruditapes philippinarum TaxID=129788 RepID=UPI00295BF978|nr:uncharacterized protein LOC132754621 [Ruditapes philippinarum]